MKKLLELKECELEVSKLLNALQRDGVFLCYHNGIGANICISIYSSTKPDRAKYHLKKDNVVFEVDTEIDEQIVDDIISQIEKVMQ